MLRALIGAFLGAVEHLRRKRTEPWFATDPAAVPWVAMDLSSCGCGVVLHGYRIHDNIYIGDTETVRCARHQEEL